MHKIIQPGCCFVCNHTRRIQPKRTTKLRKQTKGEKGSTHMRTPAKIEICNTATWTGRCVYRMHHRGSLGVCHYCCFSWLRHSTTGTYTYTNHKVKAHSRRTKPPITLGWLCSRESLLLFCCQSNRALVVGAVSLVEIFVFVVGHTMQGRWPLFRTFEF